MEMRVVALDDSNASMRFVIFSSPVFVPCAGTQGGLLLTLKLRRARANRNIRLIPRRSQTLPERSFSFYRNLLRRSAIHPTEPLSTGITNGRCGAKAVIQDRFPRCTPETHKPDYLRL
jgi:hypothetical protein